MGKQMLFLLHVHITEFGLLWLWCTQRG